MGREKSTGVGNLNYQATPQEQQLNQLQLNQAKAFDPMQRQMNEVFGNLALQLGQGKSLPGYLGKLSEGISPDVTNELVRRSMNDLSVQSQAMGLPLDSGTFQSIAGRSAADIRLGAEEFNIGTLLNLLNQSMGASAQIQQPVLATSQMLGGRLAGLRGINQSTAQYGMNPFVKSFQTTLGQRAGSTAIPTVGFKYGPFSASNA